MPPEIDDHNKARNEQLPLIDFYNFNQGVLPNSDRNVSATTARPGGLIDLSDPYSYHQGLSSLSIAVSKSTEANRASDEQKMRGGAPGAAGEGKSPSQGAVDHLYPNPFGFHQGDNKPGSEPRPFIPPVDVKPLPAPEVPPKPSDLIPRPGDRPTDFTPPNTSGKSAIVEAYERRQGARHAGTGDLPAIDAIPLPNDLRPPVPGPGPGPGPRPDIAPWTPPRPDVDPNVRPTDFRPDHSDLISKIEPKYETSSIARAIQMAKDTGLPLAVHVGAKWCPACQVMERSIWPGAEGTANQKGSLQGKMVVLHLDTDQVNQLQGEDRRLASQIMANQGNSIPYERVFKVDPSGNFQQSVREHVGSFNNTAELEQFLKAGGVGKTPAPAPRPDVVPSPRPDLVPNPNPRPNPGGFDLPPWTAPRPDVNPGPSPRPDIAPWTPPKPEVNPNIKPTDLHPDKTELISKLEPKYETDNVATAVKMAKDTGLPLAVHIGASWCGYCVQMEQQTWPGVEGTANRKGSMQGKVVVLHLDVDQAQHLQGENKQLANQLLRNRGGGVPLLRVFTVDDSGKLTKTAEHSGAINSRSGLESFLIQGGAKR